MKPILIDLFCGAGGSARGYEQAGFDIYGGFDIEPQPRYPYPFHQDTWEIGLESAKVLRDSGYVVLVHASPPCQRYSVGTKRWGREVISRHPDLIAETRAALIESELPYVIENVMGAPLINPVKLCGSMFDLRVRRHRLIEASFPITQLECRHAEQIASGPIVGVHGHTGGRSVRDGIKFGGIEEWKSAIGISWMNVKELALAMPPAYAKYVGEEFLKTLQ